MDRLRQEYYKILDKTGVALTAAQLWSKAKDLKLFDSEKNNGINKITKQSIALFLRDEPNIAKYGPVRRVKYYQSIHFLRDGLFFLDFGEFHKEWAHFNDNCTGFLVAVENLTNRLFVKPTRGKGTQEWLGAIRQFVELTRNVRTIYSDRDAVATSMKFRDLITANFNIRWYFLRKGHKAYLAERYIGFVKTKLSQAMKTRGSKRWIDFVKPICTEYNNQRIEGTSYRRKNIERANFLHFAGQLLKTDDPEMTFHGTQVSPFKTESWNKQIFKYNLNQKVLLARRANWKLRQAGERELGQRADTFAKPSMEGGFSDKKYTISGRQLRMDKSQKVLVPVYSLQELDNHLHFYETELKSIRE